MRNKKKKSGFSKVMMIVIILLLLFAALAAYTIWSRKDTSLKEKVADMLNNATTVSQEAGNTQEAGNQDTVSDNTGEAGNQDTISDTAGNLIMNNSADTLQLPEDAITAEKNTGSNSEDTAGNTSANSEDNANSAEKSYSDVSNLTQTTIQAVQEALNAAGYDCGTADGYIGDKTREAICSYADSIGISSDGEINSAILETLGITGWTDTSQDSITDQSVDSSQNADAAQENLSGQNTTALQQDDSLLISGVEQMSEPDAEKTDSKTSAKEEEDPINENGLHTSFQEKMDEIEEFFDTYVSFMTRYQENPSDEILSAQYSDLLLQYEDVKEQLQDLKDEELTDQEILYYEQALLRIEEKLKK